MDTPTKIYTITCSCGNREEVCISSKFWAYPTVCVNCGMAPAVEAGSEIITQPKLYMDPDH